MKNIAMTGSSGFIGKYVYYFLKKNKISVTAFSRKRIKNFKYISDYSKINDKFDLILYMSENANSLEYDKYKYNQIKKYQNTIKKLSKTYKRKLIYFSSASVYSDKNKRKIKENFKTYANSKYSINKIICENIVRKNNGTILRLTNIIGKNMPNRNVISTVLKQLKNKNIIIQNKYPVRDFLHINDLANLILKIIKKPKSGTYNVGFGKGININTLVKLLIKKKNKKKKIISIEKKFIFSKKVLDIHRTRKAFNWKPKIDLSKNIKFVI